MVIVSRYLTVGEIDTVRKIMLDAVTDDISNNYSTIKNSILLGLIFYNFPLSNFRNYPSYFLCGITGTNFFFTINDIIIKRAYLKKLKQMNGQTLIIYSSDEICSRTIKSQPKTINLNGQKFNLEYQSESIGKQIQKWNRLFLIKDAIIKFNSSLIGNMVWTCVCAIINHYLVNDNKLSSICLYGLMGLNTWDNFNYLTKLSHNITVKMKYLFNYKNYNDGYGQIRKIFI